LTNAWITWAQSTAVRRLVTWTPRWARQRLEDPAQMRGPLALIRVVAACRLPGQGRDGHTRVRHQWLTRLIHTALRTLWSIGARGDLQDILPGPDKVRLGLPGA
jgi:hypothetical protein